MKFRLNCCFFISRDKEAKIEAEAKQKEIEKRGEHAQEQRHHHVYHEPRK